MGCPRFCQQAAGAKVLRPAAASARNRGTAPTSKGASRREPPPSACASGAFALSNAKISYHVRSPSRAVNPTLYLTPGIGTDANSSRRGVIRGKMLAPLNNPCLTAPFGALPWCNASLSVDTRVADMVSRMSIGEKLAQLDTDAPAIPSLGLNAYNWWSEATHGVATSHVNATGSTPAATNFALPITTAASFNRTLWRETGAAISREARAFMNAGHGYSTFWAPVINLAREPRWGRNLESAGEDPYLSSEYAVSFVRGFERLREEPRYLAASACCKHYVANTRARQWPNATSSVRERARSVRSCSEPPTCPAPFAHAHALLMT